MNKIRHPQIFRMHACISLARKSLDKILEERINTGLSQCMILIYIGSRSGVCQRFISEERDITPAAVSRHVETLVQKGYVLKKENDANKREDVLEISEKGALAMDEAMGLINSELDVLFSDVTASELEVLEKVFGKFIIALGKR